MKRFSLHTIHQRHDGYSWRGVRLLLLLVFMASGLGFGMADARVWSRKAREKERQAVEAVQTWQPPPENALALYCDPFRQEAIRLAQKPWVLHPVFLPRRLWLMEKHRDCQSHLMDQEELYLKHVTVQQSPSLPRMKTDSPAPVETTQHP